MCKTHFFPLSNVNEIIRNNRFPDSLKLSDTKPLYKKVYPSDKANYRPVSVTIIIESI